ncbi:MAG: tetratricopeptide repeat protein [Paracoccaceae bacterium]
MTGRAGKFLAVITVIGLAACEGGIAAKKDPLGSNVIDAAQINDLLLTAGDPNESVIYFEAALANEPGREDFRRGLAKSLTRAKRYPEASRIYQEMIALGQDKPTDKLEYAMVAAHLQNWDEVERLVATVPAGLNTPRRYMVEALLADQKQNWSAADTAYATAESLTTNPASVLNNWGVSLMSRGDLTRAQGTFERALTYNSRLFSAKNNLAISRGLQGNYQLPVIPMTEKEKATILNNLGLIALRKGDKNVAKGLFAAAIDTHPQHYSAAADRLAALEAVVEN